MYLRVAYFCWKWTTYDNLMKSSIDNKTYWVVARGSNQGRSKEGKSWRQEQNPAQAPSTKINERERERLIIIDVEKEINLIAGPTR